MAKIFLDVGAHVGETLGVVMDSKWGFDRIYSFEPAPQCWPVLEAMADSRVTILPFGLWSRDDTLTLHDPGRIGASLVEDKRLSGETAEVEVKDAAAWFAAHLDQDDEVIMKVNCEGAECDLLDHLLEAGELHKVDEMVVHFDVRKIAAKRHQEASTRARLDAAGIRYRPAEQIFFGRDVPEKTRNWLNWYQAEGLRKYRFSVARRLEFTARITLYDLRQRLKNR